MKIYVVRHAIAEDPEEFAKTGESDELRPLTENGKRKMQKAAKGLSSLIGELPMIITSPLKRAEQTAQILNKRFSKSQVITCKELAPETVSEKATQSLRDLLKNDRNTDAIAIVGHQPQLGALVSYWLTGSAKSFVPLKKGSVTLIEFPEQVAAGQGQLKWALPASILGRMKD